MSGLTKSAVPASQDNKIELRIASEKSAWIDQISDQLSDWLSPILVKETRQALKSRQFFWTFFLLLMSIAIWTMTGMTAYDPNLDYGNSGPGLLVGYWVILGFPLAIVIPFGAYRSLAREYEDGTIQLISVTTMKAWQIVIGKLGSSMLQMLVYFSVLAPCIAFTYLLKGVSIPQMVLGLSVCSTGSLTLCSIALLLAGATRSRFYGVAASIFLIVIQFVTYFFWCMFSYGIAFGELDELVRSEGAFVSVGLLLALFTSALLFLAIAAGLISFESDNRSTLARIMLLVQQTAFMGFCFSAACLQIFDEMPVVMIFVVAHYWLLAGWFMIGEKTQMSQRVRRNVPTTVLNRSFFSFLLPGSGRGLILATTNIWACAIVLMFVFMFVSEFFPDPPDVRAGWNGNGWSWSETNRVLTGMISVCLYASFFLAAPYLICLLIRRRSGAKVNPMTAFMIGLVLMLMSIGLAMFLHFNFVQPFETNDYSNYQIFNWYWTSVELTDNTFLAVNPITAFVAAMTMILVSLFALAMASRELLQTTSAVPARVQQEISEQKKVETPQSGESIEEILAFDDEAE